MGKSKPEPTSINTEQGTSPVASSAYTNAQVEGGMGCVEAKIMVIDDEPVNCKVVRKYLSSVGYTHFVIVTDSTEVMATIRRERPDVILLDIMMPKVDGLEILGDIRSDPAIDHTPVLILTAASDTQIKHQALGLGATDFLAKPVDPNDLIPRVRNAFVLKAHHDHLAAYSQMLEAQVKDKTFELEMVNQELRNSNLMLKDEKAKADTANRSKSDFLTNMSHEIRTPMTAILGYADLISDPEASLSEIRSHSATIKNNGSHLLKIINDILDLSKIEAGKMTTEKVECNPCQVVLDVVSLMRQRATMKSLDFSVKSEGAIPETILSDATRLMTCCVRK